MKENPDYLNNRTTEYTTEIWNKDLDKAVRETLGTTYTRHVPIEAIAAAAASFEYGAKKYSDRNWEKGLPWQQMIDSLKRHVEDFERRKDYDNGRTGSGLHQVCMIMASAMMLCSSVMRNIGEDNRLPKPDQFAFDGKDCMNYIQNQLELAEKFKLDKDLEDFRDGN